MENELEQLDIEIKKHEKLLKNSENELKYKEYEGPDRIVNSYQAVEFYKSIKGELSLFKTGMDQIDEITGGFEPGELVVITGMTGNGKTLFARTLTSNLYKQDTECLWFSYEESILSIAKKFTTLPVFYLPRILTSSNLDWILEKIIESSIKFNTKAVFFDHLHYLIPLQQIQNTSILIGNLMRELKKICVENDIVIFLICHTQKIKQDETPDLSHLRDSSFVAQEADIVFYVRRVSEITAGEIEYKNESTIRILKNRKTGNLGKVRMTFINNLLEEKYDTENL